MIKRVLGVVSVLGTVGCSALTEPEPAPASVLGCYSVAYAWPPLQSDFAPKFIVVLDSLGTTTLESSQGIARQHPQGSTFPTGSWRRLDREHLELGFGSPYVGIILTLEWSGPSSQWKGTAQEYSDVGAQPPPIHAKLVSRGCD